MVCKYIVIVYKKVHTTAYILSVARDRFCWVILNGAQDAPEGDPRWPQEEPKVAQGHPKCSKTNQYNSCHGFVQRVPKSLFLGHAHWRPRCPRDDPRWLQDEPKMAPEDPKLFKMIAR